MLGLPGGIEGVTGETLVTSILIGLAPALAAPLVTALYLVNLGTGARRGGVGYAMNMVGLGLFGAAAYALNIVVFPLGPDVTLPPVSRIVILAGAGVYVVGVIWFGIAMLRARAHPRIPVILYTLEMPLFPVAAQLPDSPLTAGLHVIAGTALVWLAISLRGHMAGAGSTIMPSPDGAWRESPSAADVQ